MKNMRRLFVGSAVAAACLSAMTAVAFAQEEVELNVSIENHRFTPAELHAPAGKPITITVKNLDSTPEEFESKSLRVEKIVAGNSEITVRLRPQKPGRYRFFGEYHEDSAKGELVVE
jgi:plastocyanin